MARKTRKPTDWDFIYRPLDAGVGGRSVKSVLASGEDFRWVVPVGLPRVLENEEKAAAISRMRERIDRAVQAKRFSYAEPFYRAVQQNFCAPEEPSISGRMVRYCVQAVDFLGKSVRGLDERQRIGEWVALRPGDRFHDESCFGKGFAGHSIYDMTFVEATDALDRKRKAIVSERDHISGFRTIGRFGSDDRYQWYCAVMSSGSSAIVAPYVLMLHLTTSKACRRHERETDPSDARRLESAAVNSMGILMGFRAAKEFAIPQGTEFLRTVRQILSGKPEQRYLTAALDWIYREGPGRAYASGVQEAFDTYMESPRRFMDAIRPFIRSGNEC